MKNSYVRLLNVMIFVFGLVGLYLWFKKDPKDFLSTAPIGFFVGFLLLLILFFYQKWRNSKNKTN